MWLWGSRMDKRFWVYIVTDKPYGTLYTGVTSNLLQRYYQHKMGLVDGFTKKYHLKQLVYYEEHATAELAFHRETCIKRWKREWKIENLIKKQNLEWRDLGEDLHL